jgi:hypothetical protein
MTLRNRLKRLEQNSPSEKSEEDPLITLILAAERTSEQIANAVISYRKFGSRIGLLALVIASLSPDHQRVSQ